MGFSFGFSYYCVYMLFKCLKTIINYIILTWSTGVRAVTRALIKGWEGEEWVNNHIFSFCSIIFFWNKLLLDESIGHLSNQGAQFDDPITVPVFSHTNYFFTSIFPAIVQLAEVLPMWYIDWYGLMRVRSLSIWPWCFLHIIVKVFFQHFHIQIFFSRVFTFCKVFSFLKISKN